MRKVAMLVLVFALAAPASAWACTFESMFVTLDVTPETFYYGEDEYSTVAWDIDFQMDDCWSSQYSTELYISGTDGFYLWVPQVHWGMLEESAEDYQVSDWDVYYSATVSWWYNECPLDGQCIFNGGDDAWLYVEIPCPPDCVGSPSAELKSDSDRDVFAAEFGDRRRPIELTRTRF